jgi:hypothetical protein
LGAINSAGSSTSTITVTVKPAIAGAPDLVVTDIWLQGETVFCSVVNIGSVESEGGTCSLLQDKQEKATKYVEAIPAGQEVTVGFSKYQFRAPLKQQTSGGFGGGAMGLVVATMSEPESVEVKVCVDVNGETKESDELNNCYVKTIGSGFEFDFAKYAHIAQWRNGSGVLKWPMVAGDTRGAAFLSTYTLEDGKSYGNALGTYPQQVAFGSLQGMFGEPYTEKPGMENKTREVELPNSAKFSAKVGFKEGASRTDGVVVSFAIIEPSGKTVTLKSMKVAYDGKLDLVEADLGPMAGQKITFVLRVEAGDNYDDDYVIWVEPKLTQGQ